MTFSSSSFVFALGALGGRGSQFVEYVFIPLGLCENYLWLNYIMLRRVFGLCS